jgi:hypothetical protein
MSDRKKPCNIIIKITPGVSKVECPLLDLLFIFPSICSTRTLLIRHLQWYTRKKVYRLCVAISTLINGGWKLCKNMCRVLWKAWFDIILIVLWKYLIFLSNNTCQNFNVNCNYYLYGTTIMQNNFIVTEVKIE